MAITTPYQLLEKWKRQTLWIGVGVGMLMTGVFYLAYQYEWIDTIVGLVAGGLGLLALFYIFQKTQPSLSDALDLAHSQNPKLDFSGQLLLNQSKPTGLALLQKERAEELFGSVQYNIPWNYDILKKYILLLVGFTVGAVAVQDLWNSAVIIEEPLIDDVQLISTVDKDEGDAIDTTFLKGMVITETPPAYTGLPSKKHRNSDIQVVEGAKISWKAQAEGVIDQFYFLFSESDTSDVTRTRSIQKEFFNSDFYQYGFYSPSHDYVSDFHSIKVIRDQKPTVLISGIEEYVRLPWKARHELSFDISLSDDYGLKEAFISATIAKGSGESVKFREKEFKLKNYSTGRKNYKGSYSFRTDELGMEPGDELYFYVKTNDNYPYGDHWTKSVTHFISIADTTTYEYAEDGGMQIDLLPDFFRSQRQIIIESEQLLKDKPFVSVDSFKRASNELGFDQKMLRLKYGQFLGEENESGIAINNEMELPGEEEHDHDHDHDHDHEEGAGVSNALESARGLLSQFMHDHDHEEEEGQLMATKGTEPGEKNDPSRPTWVEELSHNHDNAEIATFHGISVKSKLKAALSEMWDAELHLRLYDPASSLPYQYQSLELLQEIKNHARIYVHRIGFDPPTIKENEIRLDGDQDKIDDRLNIAEVEIEDQYQALKELAQALGSIDLIKVSQHMEPALSALASIALKRPEVLPVLTVANNMNRNLLLATSAELSTLRRQLIGIIPAEASSVKGSNKYGHELTLSVAKKIND